MKKQDELKQLFSDRVIFGSTRVTDQRIRSIYPDAKFVPVCALGCYYSVYSDNTYDEQIAEYSYLKPDERKLITKEIESELPCFGSYFSVKIF